MSAASTNPLISDRDVEFLLYEVFGVEELCKLDAFSEHSRETFDLLLQSARRLARDILFPVYKAMDEDSPVLREGAVSVHPQLRTIYPRIVELGLINAARPEEVGGQSLPLCVAGMANAYLMAANLSAYAYIGLTSGAAHLIEAFGSDSLKRAFMTRMYSGEWSGTMALTEPQAGSSISDIQCAATPTDADHYLIKGAKIFISGGEHDLCENIVHLLLARIDGAPAGIRGVSLFAVPKKRLHEGQLADNDVHAAGLIHKIGWRGLPSLVMSYGESEDCHGWLIGEPNQGISYMFQMMNEARLMVGLHGVATASAAYHEALVYARTRLQGRPIGNKNPHDPQIPIIEHADVRRMLLRQKAIVEGGLALLGASALYADLADHAASEDERHQAQLLVDVLTPIAKSFPAERGFESNTLALQIHGGYGYSSEYLPEAWLRDQKLNSIHEGTTGIQSYDLLGRRIMADGGGALRALENAVNQTIERARAVDVPPQWRDDLSGALATIVRLTRELGKRGLSGDVEGMMLHSVDYLDLMSTFAVGWQWLAQAAAACEERKDDPNFYRGKLCAAQYWFATEMPRIELLVDLCRSAEDSYARMQPDWF
ncbi:MAG: acyl-CoA dehydrogenase [Proteobacteria bacterium]|nr:acyl-CoA dehydrogenase [Pseudomonadota bacterium]